MQKLANKLIHDRRKRAAWRSRGSLSVLLVFVFVFSTMIIFSCGGSSDSTSHQTATVAGNWQFYMDSPVDDSGTAPFIGGLQGGFLLDKGGSLTGSAVYSVDLPPDPNAPNGTPCSSGSATITGTISGQKITLTYVAGTQTITLTGTLRDDSSAIDNGTYTATAGTAADGVTPCGIATSQTNWHAVSVPPLTGAVTGSFHSDGFLLANQDFPVTGVLTQAENIGANNATVTGTLSFIDPASKLSNYPCLDTASVNGQISGNKVILQLIGLNGLNAGQIGVAPSQVNLGGNGAYPVTFDPTSKGNILHSTGTGYVVNTAACPSNASVNNQDIGYICLAIGNSGACQQPITLSPAALIFPSQLLGSTPSSQTITLSNNSSATLNGLTLAWSAESGIGSQTGQTSFTGQPNFTVSDNKAGDPCAVPIGSTFSLSAGQTCSITVTFTPQESCTWLPAQGGTPPAQCPLLLLASLTVNSPASADNDKAFEVSITGNGSSLVQPSTAELDFGAEGPAEASLPQLLSFTNHGTLPVQVLPAAPCTNVAFGQFHMLPHPLVESSPVAGLQVVSQLNQDAGNSTVDYSCDWDLTSNQPNANFQLSSDTCSGTLLEPQATCSVEVSFVPQAAYALSNGLDYFLELNTVQCVDGAADCEVDGGRFPVELTANPPSPIRMSPGAGLDFGTLGIGQGSVRKTITLLNDPASGQTVTLLSKPSVKGDYSESDVCPFSLAPGEICTLSIGFKPKVAGYEPGTITLNYATNQSANPQTQTVRLRGAGVLNPVVPQISAGKIKR